MALKSESLDTAIELEEKGYNFYVEAAQNTDNEFSKKVLKSLAEQELIHKKRFEEIAAGKDIVTEGLGQDDIEETIKGIFEAADVKEKEDWKDGETDAYEKALEMEKKTYNVYKDMLSETDDEQEQVFLKALMKEESKHEESLQNVIYYLTDYTWWLADDESQTWNWMNI